jgi:hypothetical protein
LTSIPPRPLATLNAGSIITRLRLAFLFLFVACSSTEDKEIVVECLETKSPPFDGTIFIDPDIITPDDPTTFLDLNYAGTGSRTMYDRRNGGAWVTLVPYLFNARFDDDQTIEIQVNPEFGTKELAESFANKFAPVIGRLTTELRRDVETVWIHRGMEPFGGGNNNLLIHTDWSERHYERQGILEETFVHEAAHTSLDARHAQSAEWLQAQEADCHFISTYAEDNPLREDIAESYLPYLAVRFRPDRISEALKRQIELTIPNRIKYFDSQKFNMYPIE